MTNKTEETKIRGGTGQLDDFEADDEELVKRITKQYEPDMRSVLGYLNQSEWISNINIGNIM